MSDLETQAQLRFNMKHKPRFVQGDDGKLAMEIDPEDAHLFEDNGAWWPVWMPCFVCGEKVEVPHIPGQEDAGAKLVPICGPCHRAAYEKSAK